MQVHRPDEVVSEPHDEAPDVPRESRVAGVAAEDAVSEVGIDAHRVDHEASRAEDPLGGLEQSGDEGVLVRRRVAQAPQGVPRKRVVAHLRGRQRVVE